MGPQRSTSSASPDSDVEIVFETSWTLQVGASFMKREPEEEASAAIPSVDASLTKLDMSLEPAEAVATSTPIAESNFICVINTFDETGGVDEEVSPGGRAWSRSRPTKQKMGLIRNRFTDLRELLNERKAMSPSFQWLRKDASTAVSRVKQEDQCLCIQIGDHEGHDGHETTEGYKDHEGTESHEDHEGHEGDEGSEGGGVAASSRCALRARSAGSIEVIGVVKTVRHVLAEIDLTIEEDSEEEATESVEPVVSHDSSAVKVEKEDPDECDEVVAATSSQPSEDAEDFSLACPLWRPWHAAVKKEVNTESKMAPSAPTSSWLADAARLEGSTTKVEEAAMKPDAHQGCYRNPAFCKQPSKGASKRSSATPKSPIDYPGRNRSDDPKRPCLIEGQGAALLKSPETTKLRGSHETRTALLKSPKLRGLGDTKTGLLKSPKLRRLGETRTALLKNTKPFKLRESREAGTGLLMTPEYPKLRGSHEAGMGLLMTPESPKLRRSVWLKSPKRQASMESAPGRWVGSGRETFPEAATSSQPVSRGRRGLLKTPDRSLRQGGLPVVQPAPGERRDGFFGGACNAAFMRCNLVLNPMNPALQSLLRMATSPVGPALPSGELNFTDQLGFHTNGSVPQANYEQGSTTYQSNGGQPYNSNHQPRR